MKKLLSFALLFTALAFAAPPAAQAQVVQDTGHFYSNAGRAALYRKLDTTSNTTTKSQFGVISGWQDYIGVTVSVIKLTGTPGGKVYLYGSNLSTMTKEPALVDSLVVTNIAGHQDHTFKLSRNDFTYYETRYVPTGTQTSTLETFWLRRRQYK